MTDLDIRSLERAAALGDERALTRLAEGRSYNLFPGAAGRGAAFSLDRVYRYALFREWDAAAPKLVVVGLNPSTADETKDDPTIRRCTGFAKAWGFGGLVMLNLFALRSTDPAALRGHADPVGPHNDIYLDAFTQNRQSLCAWGVGGGLLGRAGQVFARLVASGRKLVCLGLTKDGHPRHPLYVKGDTQPVEVPAEVARAWVERGR